MSKNKNTCRKKYYGCFSGYSNAYTIYYVEDSEDAKAIEGLRRYYPVERISYKRMTESCSLEKERRKYNPSFACFASASPEKASSAIDLVIWEENYYKHL